MSSLSSALTCSMVEAILGRGEGGASNRHGAFIRMWWGGGASNTKLVLQGGYLLDRRRKLKVLIVWLILKGAFYSVYRAP